MRLKVIRSGSHGNAYLLYNEQEALLIECGVKFKEIKRALNFDLSKLVGCILTHEHGDHAKGVKEVLNAGIEIYSSGGTLDAIGGNHHNMTAIPNNFPFKLGEFKILSFDVRHDAEDPCGFLINHPECGTVLFLTDTFYCPYTFKGLNNIIIEANYSKEIMREKLSDRAFLRDRILQSHMSIETCIDLLKANDLSQVNNILLIHLSDSNSNEKEFKQAIRNITAANVDVAYDGMDIEFNKTAF